MKKMIITMLLGVALLTGCENTREVNEVTKFTHDEIVDVCTNIIDNCDSIDDIVNAEQELINEIEEHWEEIGLNEYDKEEMIRVFRNRDGYHLPEYDLKTNLTILEFDYISLLDIYDILPDSYYDDILHEMHSMF